tara:strand:- start:285 stop:725 length:441 start_codon:yes stop_codon:yes gene_type:complete
MTESEMKVWLRKNWDGWMETYEPRIGSGIGIPDVQIVVDKAIIPIELKLARVEREMLYSSPIRPSQIAWHRALSEFEVPSLFLFGVGKTGKKPVRLFVSMAGPVSRWEDGLPIEDLRELPISKKGFSSELQIYVRGVKFLWRKFSE